MTTCIAVFVFALVLSAIFTNAVRMSALLLGLVDKPDYYRKIHTRPIPRLGGVGIYFAFFIPLASLFFFYHNQVSNLLLHQPVELTGLVAGSTIAMLMGMWDDIRGLRPAWKLVFQFCAASVAWASGLAITTISNPFGPTIVLGWLAYPVTVFWFIGCMNAVNLMDGLDGLAAGICLFVSLTLFLVSVLLKNVLGMLLMSCLSGAIFGFLLFNFYPAKIFLGDSGSMLLGFLIGALSLVGSTRKAETAIALLIPIVALGLPILDTSMTIIRRWYKRFPISSPDRHHIHHALISMGYSQRRVVIVLYTATLLLGGAALLITMGRSEITILVLGALALIVFVSVRVLGGLRIEDVLERLTTDQQRRRFSITAHVAVDRASEGLRGAMTLGGIWEACSHAFRDLGLDFATFQLHREDGMEGESMSWFNQGYWEQAKNPSNEDFWTGQLRIQHGDRFFGVLDIGKKSTNAAVLSVIPETMDTLRDSMGEALVRVTAGKSPTAWRPLSAAETIDESGMNDTRRRKKPAASSKDVTA